jgi:hypothetical protein
VRTLRDTGLVDEHYRLPSGLGVFFSVGHRLRFQCSMTASSRSSARPTGLWQLKPRFASTCQTPDSEYRKPVSSSMSRPTRFKVHRSVPYPATSAPAFKDSINFLRCASLSPGRRPARPAFRSPVGPSASTVAAHRDNDCRDTPSLAATCACVKPRRSKFAARMRRVCSASKSRALLIAEHPPEMDDVLHYRTVTVLFKAQ